MQNWPNICIKCPLFTLQYFRKVFAKYYFSFYIPEVCSILAGKLQKTKNIQFGIWSITLITHLKFQVLEFWTFWIYIKTILVFFQTFAVNCCVLRIFNKSCFIWTLPYKLCYMFCIKTEHVFKSEAFYMFLYSSAWKTTSH